MKKIIVASKNPVKIAATLDGFRSMFPDEEFEAVGVSVPSGVANQPFSDAETLQGALNRADAAYYHDQNAGFWVGIEGGVEDRGNEMEAFAWVVVRSKTLAGKGGLKWDLDEKGQSLFFTDFLQEQGIHPGESVLIDDNNSEMARERTHRFGIAYRRIEPRTGLVPELRVIKASLHEEA